jgi:hypothetical protein
MLYDGEEAGGSKMWVLGTMYTYSDCFTATKSGLNTQLRWRMVTRVFVEVDKLRDGSGFS